MTSWPVRWKAVASSPINFGLSENCRKIFFLSKIFCPKLQNLSLKNSVLENLRVKLKFWALVIFCVENFQLSVGILSENCNFLPNLLLTQNAAARNKWAHRAREYFQLLFMGALSNRVFTRSSKRPALARVFWIHLLEVCWTFARSCKHPISVWLAGVTVACRTGNPEVAGSTSSRGTAS